MLYPFEGPDELGHNRENKTDVSTQNKRVKNNRRSTSGSMYSGDTGRKTLSTLSRHVSGRLEEFTEGCDEVAICFIITFTLKVTPSPNDRR